MLLAAAALLGAAALWLAGPAPGARASAPCDAAGGGVGAIGIGNPLGDACNAVTDPVLGAASDVLNPLKDAAASLGRGIFSQITAWAADGATWLLGRVVARIDQTTTPDLLGRGFLRQYRRMAGIAAVMAALMLLLAVLESLGRGEGGMLVRVVFVSLPLAAIATTGAYAVVQLAIAACEGFCAAIAHGAGADTNHFFKGALEALAEFGAGAGAAQGPKGAGADAVAIPLFVGFIAAIITALGAFMVWIELLMRDAAIYAVALFMPFALAASIWPRWSGALRRTAELICVLVFSKFVIVAIIALAASLLAGAEGKVEHVLAAAALLGIACFAPFVLFRLIPFAEGAIGSAYSRQGAAGAAVRTSEIASAHMMRRAALAHWSKSARSDGEGEQKGGSAGERCAQRQPFGGGAGTSGGQGAAATGAKSSGGPAMTALGVAGGVAETAKGAGERLGSTATAQTSAPSAASSTGEGAGGRPPRPTQGDPEGGQSSEGAAATGPSPEPAGAQGGAAAGGGERPPRPAADLGAAKAKTPPPGEAKP